MGERENYSKDDEQEDSLGGLKAGPLMAKA